MNLKVGRYKVLHSGRLQSYMHKPSLTSLTKIANGGANISNVIDPTNYFSA
jgi:hypothetical protein